MKATPRQLAYLERLAITTAPMDKAHASRLIDDAVSHWEELFSSKFKGWSAAPKEISRALLISGRFSPHDRTVKISGTLDKKFLDDLVNSAIRRIAAKCLTLEPEVIENGEEYISNFASINNLHYKSDLVPFMVLARLVDNGLNSKLKQAYNQLFNSYSDEDCVKVCTRRNQINQILGEYLNDLQWITALDNLRITNQGLR